MTEDKASGGEVWLVGAGCGEGLLTLEGKRVLARAHTVLYDALVPPEVLQEAGPDAELLPVGKRSGHHSMAQEAINCLLIQKAREGKRVVRLKGGDSFVFGRGGEEALALQEAGIPWHVVPGVSSAIAVPEHFGIPVTHRGLARSFTVVTGHTRDGQDEDWQALARLQGTLVFLMGLERLETICRRLVEEGKNPDTPAAVLCGGKYVGDNGCNGFVALRKIFACQCNHSMARSSRYASCHLFYYLIIYSRSSRIACLAVLQSYVYRSRQQLYPYRRTLG